MFWLQALKPGAFSAGFNSHHPTWVLATAGIREYRSIASVVAPSDPMRQTCREMHHPDLRCRVYLNAASFAKASANDLGLSFSSSGTTRPPASTMSDTSHTTAQHRRAMYPITHPSPVPGPGR